MVFQAEALFDQLCRLYWLKPADVACDFEVLSHVIPLIPETGVILDIGCGDGIVSSLAFGGRLDPAYDRYAGLTGKYQSIGEEQKGDLFDEKLVGTALHGQYRTIDIGVDPKAYHLRAARLTSTYRELLQSTCEEMSLGDGTVDFAMSVFALYWVDDLERAVRKIAMAMRKGGGFVTVMPTEFNRHMHGANILSDAFRGNGSSIETDWFSEMEGNRRAFINRHAGSREHWSGFFGRHGLELVEVHPCMHFRRFFLQDTFQRGMFPYFLACSEAVKTPEERLAFVEKFTRPVAGAIREETENLKAKEPSAYYLLSFRKA